MAQALTLLSSRRFTAAYLVTALLVAFAGFAILADLTQFVIEVPRWVTMGTFSIRWELMALGLASMAAGYLIGRRRGYFSKRLLNGCAVAFVLMFVFGYLNAPYLMFRTQHHGARFVPIDAIRNAPVFTLKDSDEVFVVEINGDARAYPLDWIMQPHIAGDIIGGEDVALTYCSLSHLGMAVTPKIGGRKLDLVLMTQLKNNLVMFDANTEKPIQQIWAHFEGSKERMREWPTRVMSFEAFRRLYPEGLVFFNPALNPWDKVVRWMMYSIVGYQHVIEQPVFPTVHEFDTRLPNKAYVYGVRMNGEKMAFTLDFIKRQGNIVNTEVGGVPLALVYFEDYDYVDAFVRTLDGEVITVEAIDPFGVTPQGTLERAVMASEVFWFIWSTFYPDTGVRA